MRYHALATDYDGTVAHDGFIDEPTRAALERLTTSGRRLILVTGRELDELLALCPDVSFFTRIVAENGAVVYRPDTRAVRKLAEPPPAAFVQELRARKVPHLSVGHVIIATHQPHEKDVLELIRRFGLDLQVIFNRDSVMVLPAGVTKATGLAAALEELELSFHEVVGIGDAENDLAMIRACECGVAVGNAVPALKEQADLVTRQPIGYGVAELIDELIADDLASRDGELTRHRLLLGEGDGGRAVTLPAYGPNVLVAGPSGSGKSTTATGLLEQFAQHHYRFCLLDPEGDYDNFPGTVTLGGPQRPPALEEVAQAVASARDNLVVNLVGLPLNDRPPFFLGLLPRVQELRARTGRPHWLIVDEAHHLLPATWQPGTLIVPNDWKRTVFITMEPATIPAEVLATVGTVIAVGQDPVGTVEEFCAAVGDRPPSLAVQDLEVGEVLCWERRRPDRGERVRLVRSQAQHRRHTRKYAEGELPPDRCFYYRGRDGRLNLRAQNLFLFLQIGEGVDDETWLFHLRAGDYSRWFRDRLRDPDLGDAAAAVEARADQLGAADSREQIRQAVERRYTLPASPPLPIPGTAGAPRHN